MHLTRESVFIGAIRAFCTSFAAILGISFAVVVLFIFLTIASSPSSLPPKAEMRIAADAQGNRDLLPESAPVILHLDFNGIIGAGDLTAEKVRTLLLDSRIDTLKNNRVKALFLHMNTPGGLAYDSEEIYHSLKEYKKKYNVPIYAFVDGLCASGGVYIAAAADKIYATPGSVIGSVGALLGPSFNFAGLMDKIGVESKTFSEGKDKDMLNPFRPWKQGEDESLHIITRDLYERFVHVVVEARPRLSRAKLVEDYGAQVFTASQALDFGFIDNASSDYGSAMKALAKAANLPENQPYQVMELQTSHPFLFDLMQGKSPLFTGKVNHVFQMGPAMSSEMSGKFLYLYQPN
ncbi:MAG: S49 family peptidase [Anaerolineae bacterium]